MRLTKQQLLAALARMPFADTLELAVILGEAYATVHRALTGLLADGIAARVNHGTVHLCVACQMELWPRRLEAQGL